ncbi:MAG: polysaccharide deacetylase family protein [Candidatus Omnitrophica bacterium]|nr:polysaccharide deacetylase family protein [Candidatus Omnitrophota bacterium]
MTRDCLKYLYGKFWFLTRYIIKNKNDCPNGAVRILVYHNIPYKKIDHFRNHLLFIFNNYGFFDPNDFELFNIGKIKFKGIRVLITFDDGFKSQFYATQEVLESLGIKAIFFIPVNFIGLNNFSDIKKFINNNLNIKTNPSDEFFPMGWDDLYNLSIKGHIIGSHTESHPWLPTILNHKILRDEIWRSGDTIESRLGISVNWFSYPYGRRRSVSYEGYMIANKRYIYCASDIGGLNSPNGECNWIRRDSIKVDASLDFLRLVLEGGLDFINFWRFRNFKKASEERKYK